MNAELHGAIMGLACETQLKIILLELVRRIEVLEVMSEEV